MGYEKLEKRHSIQNVKIHFTNKNMPKSYIHPNWFQNTPVLCDGKLLCFTESTKEELQIDMWLANHPFYNNSQVIIDSEGRVEKFMKKYNLENSN